MTRFTRLFTSALISILAFAIIRPPTIYAQPVLVQATPPPGVILDYAPDRVTLVFDRPLRDRGSAVWVMNGEGMQVDNQDSTINPANRRQMTVTLPPLLEGTYQVQYQATAIGGSTIGSGAYTFNIDLPDPRLNLKTPIDGQTFHQMDIPFELETSFFDFNLFDNRVRLYVDGQLEAEIQSTTYTLQNVEPGVHRIRMVLTRFEDEELPETETIVNIAVAQPVDPPPAPPPPVSWQPELIEAGGMLLGTLLLLGVGFWLGKHPIHNGTNQYDE